VASAAALNGTPTFYVQRQRYDAAYDFDTLLSAVERAADRA
jgi:protein-disulfide isomerase